MAHDMKALAATAVTVVQCAGVTYQVVRELDSWFKLSLTPHTLRIVKAVQKVLNT